MLTQLSSPGCPIHEIDKSISEGKPLWIIICNNNIIRMHQASSFICISGARNDKNIQKSFKMMKNFKQNFKAQ